MHYVMADLHGEYDRWRPMLDRIEFSASDTLYILGDVVDRSGFGGVDILLDIMERSNVVTLLGNHETMCLKAIDQPDNERAVNHWLRNGGQATYDALCRLPEDQRARVLGFIRSMPDHLDLEVGERKFHLVHAFPADNTYDRVWLRPGANAVSPFPDGRIVVAGHTPVCSLFEEDVEARSDICVREFPGEHFRIYHGQGYINIDCVCGYPEMPKRRLACLRLEDMAEFYT